MEDRQRQKITAILQAPKSERGFARTPERATELVGTAERVEARLIEELGPNALYTYDLANGELATTTIDQIWPICGAPIATLPEQVMYGVFISYHEKTTGLSDQALAASLRSGEALVAKYQS